MTDFDIHNAIPLSTVVKAAVISLGEDLSKVEATLTHYAGRTWIEFNNRYIGAKVERGIFPVHKNFSSVAIPCGTKKVLFVGLINDCGDKIELECNTKLTGQIKEHVEHDKCNECKQDKDICEQLVAYPKEESIVEINGIDYKNTIEKYFEKGNYFIVKRLWIKNITTGLAEQIVTQEFLSCFDMLDCGCIAPTDENIQKVKENCYDCYCKCYSSCLQNEFSEGQYRLDLDNGLILLNKDFGYDKVYVEYKTALPRVNGELVVPDFTYEAMVAGIICKATQYKKSIGLGEKQLNKKLYSDEQKNMLKIMCRVSLNDLYNIFTKIPKFDLNIRTYSCPTYGKNMFNSVQSTSTRIPSFTPPIAQIIGKEINLFPYTSAGLQEDFISNNLLLDKKIVGVFKDGQGFLPIDTNDIFDTNKKQFKYFPLLGKIQFSIPFYGTEDAFIQYY